MPTTPTFGLPYPDGNDSPDMAYWNGQLAAAVEAALSALPVKFNMEGPVGMTFNGSGEATITHGLGVLPKYFDINADSSGFAAQVIIRAKVSTATVNTIVVSATNLGGTVYAGSLSAVRWVAMA